MEYCGYAFGGLMFAGVCWVVIYDLFISKDTDGDW